MHTKEEDNPVYHPGLALNQLTTFQLGRGLIFTIQVED
jgi:hypothetical protein